MDTAQLLYNKPYYTSVFLELTSWYTKANLYTWLLVQRIFEVSTSPDNNIAAILEIVAPTLIALLTDVELSGTISPPVTWRI